MTQICPNKRSVLSAVAFPLNFCIGAIIMPNPARNAGFGILWRPTRWNTVLLRSIPIVSISMHRLAFDKAERVRSTTRSTRRASR